MNHELLQRAQAALSLRDIYQRQVSVMLAEDYEPTFEPRDQELRVLSKHIVTQVQILKPAEDESQLPYILRVFLEMGVRWYPEDEGGNSGDASSQAGDDQVKPLGEIEATYVADYEMQEELDGAAIDEFALHNPSYHVWPYFREFVAAQCARMNIPKLVLPMRRLASNTHQPGGSTPE